MFRSARRLQRWAFARRGLGRDTLAHPSLIAARGRGAAFAHQGFISGRGWGAGGLRRFAEEVDPYKDAGAAAKGCRIFHQETPFSLLSGKELPELKVAYEMWGTLNSNKDNAILLHTGMSASSHARSHYQNTSPGWWEEFIGPGKALDTNIFCVICTNNLGGCFGSTGPSSLDPRTGKPFGSTFPRFTVQDQVVAQFKLLDHLGISRLHAAVGASLGGMQSICSAAMFPDRVRKVVSISGCAKSYTGTMAFRYIQRRAIMSDPDWRGGDYYDGPLPAAGLQLARAVGTITYRSGKEWSDRFGQRQRKGYDNSTNSVAEEWEIEHYLDHQGKKWVGVYDPNSLMWISKAMDGFTLEKPGPDGKPSLAVGLQDVKQPALIIGVQYDVLFPVWQQREIAETLRKNKNGHVVYYELDSVYGHDCFLLDVHSIGPAVKGHLEGPPFGAEELWKEVAASTARVAQKMVSRTPSADAARYLYNSLAHGDGDVDADRLLAMVKLIFDVDSERAERLWAERFGVGSSVSGTRHVQLPEFLEALERLSEPEEQVYIM